MRFFDYFRRAPKSASLAKDRLSIIVARERSGTRSGGADYLPQLQQELVASGWVTADLEHPNYRALWRALSAA